MKNLTIIHQDTIYPERSHTYKTVLENDAADKRIDFVLRAAKNVGFELKSVKGDSDIAIYLEHQNGSTYHIELMEQS